MRCFVRDWRHNCVWSCIELWSCTAFLLFVFFFFKPSELFLQGKPDPGFGFPSVFCQAEPHGRYCRCIDVSLILVCGMLVFSYVCIYFFPYWLKKAHTFQALELILFEKIGEVKELKHWLLSPESQDTIQGLMNCTLFLLCYSDKSSSTENHLCRFQFTGTDILLKVSFFSLAFNLFV